MNKKQNIWNENLRKLVAAFGLDDTQIHNWCSDLQLAFSTEKDCRTFIEKAKRLGFSVQRFTPQKGTDWAQANMRCVELPFQYADERSQRVG